MNIYYRIKVTVVCRGSEGGRTALESWVKEENPLVGHQSTFDRKGQVVIYRKEFLKNESSQGAKSQAQTPDDQRRGGVTM